VFVAVINNGGFTAAGRAIGVSTSAVSKRFNQLESHLDVRLFQRTTRKHSLTEAGGCYYEQMDRSI
jgi:DNA-binding transcriptional LysR family regulator